MSFMDYRDEDLSLTERFKDQVSAFSFPAFIVASSIALAASAHSPSKDHSAVSPSSSAYEHVDLD